MRKKHGLGKKVGGRLRELRKGASLTQRGLALKAGLNLKYVGEIELGNRDVRLATLERLARALGVEPQARERVPAAGRDRQVGLPPSDRPHPLTGPPTRATLAPCLLAVADPTRQISRIPCPPSVGRAISTPP
ncbi:MAG: helix-turn-helix transcriptional regulator [Candidatus Riflebacteria bacterium]|nr:helix-turn-helix transcriptional regulator [Candidatus Riflebacteria bacterium]